MAAEKCVTVVMPVCNGAAYLEQAIDSVLAQTHETIEVIAVDDGSTDESPQVLGRYGGRIKVLRQQNAGVAAARNSGIQRAGGEFVAFLDQDDWWHPEKLKRQVELFRREESTGLVHTDVAHFSQEQKKFVPSPNPSTDPASMVGDCFERLLLGNHIANSSVVVRRSALNVVGHCNTGLGKNTVADYDLWLRLAQTCRIGFVDAPLTCFRVHARQGQQNRIAMLSDEIDVVLQHRHERQWKKTRSGRQRLGRLYDELATAYFDGSQPHPARCYFAKAVLCNPSPRQFVRCLASCLPYWLALRCRDSAIRFRKHRLSGGAQQTRIRPLTGKLNETPVK